MSCHKGEQSRLVHLRTSSGQVEDIAGFNQQVALLPERGRQLIAAFTREVDLEIHAPAGCVGETRVGNRSASAAKAMTPLAVCVSHRQKFTSTGSRKRCGATADIPLTVESGHGGYCLRSPVAVKTFGQEGRNFVSPTNQGAPDTKRMGVAILNQGERFPFGHGDSGRAPAAAEAGGNRGQKGSDLLR